MSEDANTILSKDHRPEILKEIDSFNDAPGFGMMGILEKEARESGQLPAPEGVQGAPLPGQAERTPEWQEAIEKGYAPLNTSIQEVNRKYEGRMTALERQNQQLMQQNQQIMNLVQQQSQQQRRAYEESIDPDTPITYGYMQQALSPLQQIQQQQVQMQQAFQQGMLKNEYYHALSELERFKLGNPNVPVRKEDVDRIFTDFVQGDPSKAARIDWRQHFDAQKMQHGSSELETLKAENEKLKQQLTGRPAQTPANKVPPEQRLSPATKPATRTEHTISTPHGQGTPEVADITQWKSFRKKGGFKNFGRDLGKRLGVLG